ncbi:single-strand binding protein, partial [Enterococcus faecalis 13-SD-W-01]
IWRKPAETMANLAKKGSLIGVVGRIQTRSYENQQGQRVYVTEVVADNFQLLESKAATENRTHQDQSQGEPGTNAFEQSTTQPDRSQDYFAGQSIDISNEDLPF